MRRIIEAQKGAIEKELSTRKEAEKAREARSRQGLLPFGSEWLPEEREQQEQYEADTRHIQKRQSILEKELESEPRRIREQYDVKHHRLERVGLVYLWSASS